MKTNSYIRLLIAAILCLGSCAAFTSCNDDDWDDGYSYGYYDRDLIGTWELVQINGEIISPANANYFSFYGNGNGTYYAHRNGVQYSEPISYWCSDTYASQYITINYASGSESQMQYWFSNAGRSLWMQWLTTSGLVTYRYEIISGVPW